MKVSEEVTSRNSLRSNLRAALPMKQIIVDKPLLDEIVRRLVKAVDPDRIILFGSRARGDARPDSDIDLLIIKDTDEPGYRRAIPAYRALSGMGVPKDIIWRTPAEVEDWSCVPTYVTTRALKEGKILYEKRS
jgi:predicted nucleotidyltransferase